MRYVFAVLFVASLALIPDKFPTGGYYMWDQAGRVLAVEDTTDLAVGNGTWTTVNFTEIEDTLDCNTTPAEATPYTTFRLKHTGRWKASIFAAMENRSGAGLATDFGLKFLINDTTYFFVATSTTTGHSHTTVSPAFYFILDAGDTTSWTEAGISKGYATVSVQVIANKASSFLSGDAVVDDFPITVGTHPHSRYMILEWLGY